MPQPLEGVLNQEHRNSLEIVDFIFHIINPDATDDQKVIYLDEVQLQQKQKAFFLERLKEIAEGTQYVFKPNAVDLKTKCQALLETPEDFVEISRQITESFSAQHDGTKSSGVFVISTVKYLASANNWQKLIFLVKMDTGASFSYSYEEVDGKLVAVMSEIENALNETKTAIQKSALIDVSDVFAWDLLAFDRVKKPSIGEYFRGFLGATERQQDSVLTRTAHAAVRKWARRLAPEQMPEGEDALGYIGRALNYLTDHTAFDTDEYLNAVIRDEDNDRKAQLTASLREELANVGVAGQQFVPKPDSLPNKDKKQTYQTQEGVTVVFQGDKDAAGLTITNLPNGKKQIIIETGGYTIK